MIIFPTNTDLSPSKRIKFGIDPTFSSLHLGHFIPLRFVKKMKELGHHITIVLGTFTAQLGDPSGRDSTRPILSEKDVEDNAQKIMIKVKEILGDVEFFMNGDLHNKMSLPIFLKDVASKFTLAHMTSRNGFANRIQNNQSIAIHELLVPMLQGMDSVHLKSEIEVGGEDQLFNFQMARQLQEIHEQKPQGCVMFPVINGTDGRKMSKSLGNCIFLDESLNDIFGKIMSISDKVMDEWFPLLTDIKKPSDHPMENKKALAVDIVQQLFRKEKAIQAKDFFEKAIQNKELPSEIKSIKAFSVVEAIRNIRNCSITQAKNLIEGKGVKVDGEMVSENIPLKSGQIVQVGKRDFAKLL